MKISEAYKIKQKILTEINPMLDVKIKLDHLDSNPPYLTVKTIIDEEDCFEVVITKSMKIDKEKNLPTIFGKIGLDHENRYFKLNKKYTSYINDRISDKLNIINEYEKNMDNLDLAKKILKLEL